MNLRTKRKTLQNFLQNLKIRKIKRIKKIKSAKNPNVIDKREDNLWKESLPELEDKRIVALCSGTSAVLLALVALGVKAGDEVICQSFTFIGNLLS